MQNQGGIGPSTVAELLQTMHQERATGTLSLSSDGRECSMHFLFGHLFHAVGGSEEGEAAVLDAIGWKDGDYAFNPRAKLPPEETINSSTDKLLEEASKRSARATPAAVEAVVRPTQPEAVLGVAGRPVAAGSGAEPEEDWRPAPASSQAQAPVAAAVPVVQPPSPQLDVAQNGGSSNGVRVVDAAVVAPTPAVARVQPTAPQRRPTAPYPPAQSARPVSGGSRAQLSVLIPMPSGAALHSGLKASFLNFPMFLKTLGQDGFSGYASVRGEGDHRNVGHILFKEGAVIQAQLRSGGAYRRGKSALQEVVRAVGQGEGLIDAIEVPTELVAGVAALVNATTMFVNLPARIVDFNAMLQYVEEQRTTGGILVTVQDQVSVALVDQGEVKGSYSSVSPEMIAGPEAASSSADDREARIDVVSSPAEALAALEVSEAG